MLSKIKSRRMGQKRNLSYNTNMTAAETKKRNLGQFFTTNSDYILQGFQEKE